jgi:hypothetical protein
MRASLRLSMASTHPAGRHHVARVRGPRRFAHPALCLANLLELAPGAPVVQDLGGQGQALPRRRRVTEFQQLSGQLQGTRSQIAGRARFAARNRQHIACFQCWADPTAYRRQPVRRDNAYLEPQGKADFLELG